LADPAGMECETGPNRGTVVNLQTNNFIGNNMRLEKCIQRFLVKDDTGTIQAVYARSTPMTRW
jgi:hypothetical protein